MEAQVVLVFPYGGLRTEIEKCIFKKLIEISRDHTNQDVIVVIEKSSLEEIKRKNDNCLDDRRGVTVLPTWSVDTCQRWLTGWGYILDQSNKIDRVILLPGDIEKIGDIALDFSEIDYLPENIDINKEILLAIESGLYSLKDTIIVGKLNEKHKFIIKKYLDNLRAFFERITQFILLGNREGEKFDIVIGDYKSPNHSAKELIDTYGTFPLVSNWFREAFRKITNNIYEINDSNNIGLIKPRSEFINIRKDVLEMLINKYNPFAYEQTLNLIINWYINEKQENGIYKFTLGDLQDDKTFRKYKNCIDQIERTERMLKFVWRRTNEPKQKSYKTVQDFKEAYHKYMLEYAEHDKRSNAICETANIVLENFLM